jgi:hypothetical protein
MPSLRTAASPCRCPCWAFACLPSAVIALSVSVRAAEPNGTIQAPDRPALPSEEAWPRLTASVGWGAGLDGVVGLAMPAESDTQSAHAFAGGLARVHWTYIEIGGAYVATDVSSDEWRSVEGFVGAWLPFHRWVDVEAAGGVARRTYSSSDTRYGPNGFSVANTALTLRVGASARTSEGWLGARAGGAIVAALDVGRENLRWSYELGSVENPRVIEGRSPIGGFTLALQLSLGLDVSPPKASP